MKKTVCTALCLLLIFSLCPVVSAQSPVIEGLSDGQTVNGDLTVSWEHIENAQYYTVNVRYIQNSDTGPLLYDAVKTENNFFTLEKSKMDELGFGTYRICVASYIDGKAYYSKVAVFYYTNEISPITEKTVVCFGDSLTASGVWENILSARFGTLFINSGVGGTTTESSKARFKSDVIDKAPDITLICFAYNDAVKIDRVASRVSLEEYKANLEYYVNELVSIGSDVILFSPNPIIEEYFNANPLHPGEDYIEDGGINALLSRYTDIMRQVAEKYGQYYFDLGACFEGEDLYTLINKDGTHPANSGYQIYAKELGDFIQKEYGTEYIVGDLNENGKIDMGDYLLCRRLTEGNKTATPRITAISDTNQNGKTDADDSEKIKDTFLKTYNTTE